MINMDECEWSVSDFSDETLAMIAAFCGPWVATMLMTPRYVPIDMEGATCLTSLLESERVS